MQRSSTLLFLTLLLVVFSADLKAQLPANPTPVSVHGALRVNGSHIVDQIGNVVSFAGNSFSLSNTYNAAEPFYNADVVKWLQDDWGSTIVRAAMGVDAVSGYFDFPVANLDRITTVIDAAIANDMYIIIDWHSHHAELYQAEAIEFFRMMAQRYGHNPHVIYEIYNEPIHVSWSNTVKPYAEAVISAIREIDPDNLIIVGTPTWSQDVDIASLDPIRGFDNIAYTLHFYAATHGESLRQKAQTAIDNGLPLFVTEWGTVEATADGPVNELETERWIAFLRENDLSHCNWSLTGKDEGATITLPGSNPRGGWSDSDLSESGRIAKEIISTWPRYGGDNSEVEVAPNTEVEVVTGAFPDGVPHAIPGFINPYYYDNGGWGIAYFDTTQGNFGEGIRQHEDVDGGHGIVGWIEEGEWLEYTVNVQTSGRYFVSYAVASLFPGEFYVEFDGQNKTGTVEVESTGSWVEFDSVGSVIDLDAGEQKMRIVMGRGTFNLSDIYFALDQADSVPPTIAIDSVAVTDSATGNLITIEGTSTDNVSVDRNRLLLYDSARQLYWNGSAWQSGASFVSPGNELNDWSYTLDVPVGGPYRVTAWTWDSSNNLSPAVTRQFSGASDDVLPVVEIDSVDVASSNSENGTATISGSSSDNVSVDRTRLLLYDSTRQRYWNGSAWQSGASFITPDNELNDWSYALELPVDGQYRVTAWTWDSSNNLSKGVNRQFSGLSDDVLPVAEINSLNVVSLNSNTKRLTISGSSTDNVSVDRNIMLIYDSTLQRYWNGSAWQNGATFFSPGTELRQWSYTLDLPTDSQYRVTAWTFDSSNNLSAGSSRQIR